MSADVSAPLHTQTNNSNNTGLSDVLSETGDGAEFVILRADRRGVDAVEILYLSVIIVVGMSLNVNAFIGLMRQPRTPTASTNFLTGPYHTSSFVLFKINLSIMDFAILLIHALGKVIWLLTYDWKFGDVGCKLYQFLSAFTYYGNSNLIVAIGIDRLIVVYTSHIQGATSKRRVRLLLLVTWLMAAICALPQLFIWTSVEVSSGFYQCTTMWQVNAHRSWPAPDSHALLFYEMFHQSIVFWLPFLILLFSYLFIIAKVISYTFSGAQQQKPSSSNTNGLSRTKNCGASKTYRKPSLRHLSSPLRLFDGTDCRRDQLLLGTPSSNTLSEMAYTTETTAKSDPNGSPRLFKSNELPARQSRRLSDTTEYATLVMACPTSSARGADALQIPQDSCSSDVQFLVICSLDNSSNSDTLVVGGRRKPTSWRMTNIVVSVHQKLVEKFASLKSRRSKPNTPKRTATGTSLSRHFSQRQQKAVQMWKRQLRSRVFATSLAIVVAHCALWLPYNLLNSLRFFDARVYMWAGANGGFLLEDLIVLNSVVNPILYGYENKWRGCGRPRQ